MSYFVHRSLTPDEKRIRLVHILPGQYASESEVGPAYGLVECTVSHVLLDNAPAYTALSYNWGNIARTESIQLNGKRHHVTENLHLALRHLRKSDQSMTVWADALCIDQDDDVEKSEQLEQMRQIYSQATTVTAWLGEEGDNSNIAMQWIQLYGSRAFDLGIGTKPALQLRSILRRTELATDEFAQTDLGVFAEEIKTHLLGRDSGSLIRSLSKLLLRPYWSRVWVVQELVSASTISFTCGNQVATEEAVHHALRLLRNLRRHHTLTGPEMNLQNDHASIVSINTRDPICLLKLRRAAGPFPLIYLVRTLRGFKATDPRDKVFALLNISEDADKLCLRPNYSKTCQEVYTDFARALLRNGYFDILSFCEPSKQVSSLPSWTPDWSTEITRAPLQQRSLQRSSNPLFADLEPRFFASGRHEGVSVLRENMATGLSFSVRAMKLGHIEKCGLKWEEGNVATWLTNLEGFFRVSSNAFKSPEEIREAIWRSAVADQGIRQGTSKPRLAQSVLDALHSRFKETPLTGLSADSFVSSELGHYYEELKTLAPGRRAFRGSSDLVGLAPQESMVGDVLVILLGNQIPSLLRRRNHDKKWEFVGDVFIYGAMDGEASEQSHTIESLDIW